MNAIDPHEAYFALPGINWSLLKEAARSPKHFKHAQVTPRTDTSAMALGRAAHMAVLEPDLLLTHYTVWAGSRRTKEYAEFCAVNAGKEILTEAEWDKVLAIKRAVCSHPDARRLLRSGAREKTARWTDLPSGLRLKARADLVKRDAVWDFKTAKSITEHDFARAVATMLYHGQAAFYCAGFQRPRFGFIAVESEAPHDVAVFELDDDSMFAGEQLVRELLDTVAACRKARRWPGQFPVTTRISLPGWAFPDDGTRKLEGLA